MKQYGLNVHNKVWGGMEIKKFNPMAHLVI